MINLISALTITRIIFSLAIFYFLTSNDKYIFALLFFIIAGITDYFDGFLARKYDATSQFGEILDTIADKILIVFCFFGLAINLSSYLIGFVASIIISRELWVSALRDLNARNNNQSATKVTYIAKIKTSIQIFTISLYLFALAADIMLLIIISDIFLIITLLVTLYSGYEYTINSFKIK